MHEHFSDPNEQARISCHVYYSTFIAITRIIVLHVISIGKKWNLGKRRVIKWAQITKNQDVRNENHVSPHFLSSLDKTKWSMVNGNI